MFFPPNLRGEKCFQEGREIFRLEKVHRDRNFNENMINLARSLSLWISIDGNADKSRYFPIIWESQKKCFAFQELLFEEEIS